MKAKLFTGAALMLAGLGFLAGRHNPSAPGALHPQTATPSVEPVRDDDGGAVVTPLVAKLYPGGTAEPSAADAPPDHFVESSKMVGPADGQLSPGGRFRYEAARNAYIPVDFGHVRYTHRGRPVSAAHLIDHGHHPSSVAKWTQREREIAHANDHAVMSPVRSRSINASQETVFRNTCPGGRCLAPARGFRLLRR